MKTRFLRGKLKTTMKLHSSLSLRMRLPVTAACIDRTPGAGAPAGIRPQSAGWPGDSNVILGPLHHLAMRPQPQSSSR